MNRKATTESHLIDLAHDRARQRADQNRVRDWADWLAILDSELARFF